MIELEPVPDAEWTNEFNNVLQDEYVRKKYNRKKRLEEKAEYIKQFFPGIHEGRTPSNHKKTCVLDIGTGPGEFLEICRTKGCDICGIDAPPGESEMGEKYLVLSQLMTRRQKIPVFYTDALKEFPLLGKRFDYINSQGAIEQIFKDYMLGTPHKLHKDCHRLSWNICEQTFVAIKGFLQTYSNVMNKSGIMFIYGNGAKNSEEYSAMLIEASKQIDGFNCIRTLSNRQHFFRKD